MITFVIYFVFTNQYKFKIKFVKFCLTQLGSESFFVNSIFFLLLIQFNAYLDTNMIHILPNERYPLPILFCIFYGFVVTFEMHIFEF